MGLILGLYNHEKIFCDMASYVAIGMHIQMEMGVTSCECVYNSIYVFVGSCLATKVFIGNLPAMRRGWVIIK